MFLGSVIYIKRRSLNLTQKELAKDLCQQNTISKIEKHNMKPELSVLIQICKRLGLTLNEVFSDFSNSNLMGATDALDLIEEQALLDESSDIQEKLDAIKNDLSRVDLVQFNLIKGVLAFNQYNYDKSYFYFDKVLQGTKSDTDNIWTLIAYITKGMILLCQKHIDMANYYFDIVNNTIEKNSMFLMQNKWKYFLFVNHWVKRISKLMRLLKPLLLLNEVLIMMSRIIDHILSIT